MKLMSLRLRRLYRRHVKVVGMRGDFSLWSYSFGTGMRRPFKRDGKGVRASVPFFMARIKGWI